MIFKIFTAGLCLLFFNPSILAAQQKNQIEPEQQIGDFSVAGYGEKGRKDWDIWSRSADVSAGAVKLNDVRGNFYGNEEVKLTADRGNFNKTDGKVHLEQNVVVTTTSGAKLTTDSLDWDRKGRLVTTAEPVNIKKDNIVVDARGAKGQPDLKKVALEKEVKVRIDPLDKDKDAGAGAGPKEKIVITCDGPLDVDYEKNIASFNNNVKVERLDSVIYSDKMDVFFVSAKGKERQEKSSGDNALPLASSKIEKIIARGNVKVVQGENTSYCDEALYDVSDRKIHLTGRPKLVIYSQEGFKQ